MDSHHSLLPCWKKWGSNGTEQDRACATAWHWTHISYRFMGYKLLEDLRLQSQALELQDHFSQLLLLALFYNAIDSKTQAKTRKSLIKIIWSTHRKIQFNSSSFSIQFYIPWPSLVSLSTLFTVEPFEKKPINPPKFSRTKSFYQNQRKISEESQFMWNSTKSWPLCNA